MVVNVNSDSADDTLKVAGLQEGHARQAPPRTRMCSWQRSMLVELDTRCDKREGLERQRHPGVHAHQVAVCRVLQVDEEDEIEIEFGNLRSSIDVENEAPEIDNFSPAHEMAFDDADVDYAFSDQLTPTPACRSLRTCRTWTATHAYTPVVALISSANSARRTVAQARHSRRTDGGVLNAAAHVHEDETLYCPGSRCRMANTTAANVGGWGYAPIRDDKDFDDVDDGYDVETTIVLTENRTYYVTFIVCDNAGNCAFYDPDGNDDNEELAQITVDTEDPVFVEARTGLTWDSTDNEYDDNRSFIQVIFNELTALNPETVETDDS